MNASLDLFREAALAFRLRRYARNITKGRMRGPLPEFLPETQVFYGLLLDEARTLSPGEMDPGLLIDIGCADWGYLPALVEKFPQATRLFGFEADPGRVYWNGLSRGRLADGRSRRFSCEPGQLREVLFVPGDFLEIPLPWSPPVGVVPPSLLFTAFFPFVSEAPARAWGLPGRFANFAALLAQVRSAAATIHDAKPAALLTVHQGAWEDEIAARVLRDANWRTGAVRVERARYERIWPGKHDVFVRFSKGPPFQK